MLRVESLGIGFATAPERLWALEEVDLCLAAGEAHGVVGESGAGKSTLARCILGIERPSRGRVVYEGQEVGAMDPGQLRVYWRRVQIIWQDPILALNPAQRVGDILAEPLRNHFPLTKAARTERVAELLALVELDIALAARFPHQLSGGQAQRVCVARALALEPRLLICDEPVSALDLPLQLKVMDLLADLRRRLGLGLLIITHDLALARRYCERVSIMWRGRVVERGAAGRVLVTPSHAYTQGLVAASPRMPWSKGA